MFMSASEKAELLAYAGKFDATICGDDLYTARVFEACAPRLKVISKWGTGIDSIDSETCSRLGVKLYRTLNAFTTPVANSVMGYALAFARRQPWMDRDLKAGHWQRGARPCPQRADSRGHRSGQHRKSRDTPCTGLRHAGPGQ